MWPASLPAAPRTRVAAASLVAPSTERDTPGVRRTSVHEARRYMIEIILFSVFIAGIVIGGLIADRGGPPALG